MANKKEVKKDEVVATEEVKTVDYGTHIPDVKAPMADDKSAKEVIADDQKVKDAIAEGNVVIDANTATILQKPLVPDYHTGQPKYETADQANAALAMQGKLTTPASTEVIEKEDEKSEDSTED